MECIKYDVKDKIENIIKNKKNETEELDKKEEIEYYDTIIENIYHNAKSKG